MNIIVRDKEFNYKYVIDTYESLIWTDRYYGYGDFELYLPFNADILNKVRQDYYLQIADSRSTMIVESIRIDTSSESGNHLIITGRSLECLLERRVIWPKIELKGKLYNAIKRVITDAITDPKKSRFKKGDKQTNTYIKRKIDNFIFEESADTTITVDPKLEPEEYNGSNLYEVILNWCQENEIGFEVTLEDEYEYNGQILYNQFVMRLYRGVDRSYEQDNFNWVVFSPSYDNIISTNYIDDTSPWKNFAIVEAEDGADPPYIVYGDTKKESGQYVTVGVDHRELYVDARDINPSELEELSFDDALKMRGAEQLNENLKDIEFSGEVEARRQFVFGRDFYMGDIVEITNEYGIQGAARVIEYIHNDTDSGSDIYPTFEAIQDYGYDTGD